MDRAQQQHGKPRPEAGQPSRLVPEGYCDAEDVPLPALTDRSDAGIARWAEGLVRRMSPEEKLRLLKGLGWTDGMQQLEGWYVGNILAIPRLGIPSLQMQDSSQGFRTTEQAMIGEVTAWPCALAVSANWDVKATQRWAKAIGEEFRAKGANVVLGPGVNVHRVALNGRNAEYISGEDPYLGARQTEAWVRGMQDDAGVAAVVKHFLMNEQETNRKYMDARVDEQTRWEQYYPPFEAAVKAGVAAVMCALNYVNGEQACSNSHALLNELKGTMGFTGWVMTDWWALQNDKGAMSGTDQEQPGSRGYFSPEAMAALPLGRLDDMAERVLHGMARGSRLWRDALIPCRLGCNCRHLLSEAVATSPAHVALARELAAGGAVLLKNEPRPGMGGLPTLPLRSGETVAVIGGSCALPENADSMVGDWLAKDYYVVGGSGRVLSSKTVSVLEGLRPRGLVLKESPSDDIAGAQAALQGAAVALICAGAATAESFDRSSLRLDQEVFIAQVQRLASAAHVPVVVLALVPGAIVAPWRHAAAAAIAFFLSGQETGSAVADVLLGTVSPSGKLPVTFPEDESHAIPPCAQTCEYSERMSGGWHVYDGKPVAYPFGHGLSYTRFEFSVARNWSPQADEDGARSLRIHVRNTGDTRGAEVLQLYLGLPSSERGAGHPELVLRGFEKTRVLAPGETAEVQFSLTPRDISVWDVSQHGWRLAVGPFLTKVGSSSRDLRLCGGFQDEVVQEMLPC